MPGQSKTSAVRVLVGCAALDSTCELWIHELKGTGDLDPFEQCSHRFISGIDDESIGYAAESLAKLRREVMTRAGRIRKLDRALCPDKKVSREIANRRSLRLHPLVCVVDELQNLMGHDKFGKQAGDDAARSAAAPRGAAAARHRAGPRDPYPPECHARRARRDPAAQHRGQVTNGRMVRVTHSPAGTLR
jgi:hypothetical protein